MKTINDIAALFLTKWDGPKLTFVKKRHTFFYETGGTLIFFKFVKVLSALSQLKVNVIIGFENISVAQIHSEVMEQKYEKLKYITWSIQLGFWIHRSELEVCRKAHRNTRKKFSDLGWSFQSNEDLEPNVKQMIKFAKIAQDDLRSKSSDPDFLQSLKSISDDGRVLREWPLYLLQMADLYSKGDKNGLRDKLKKMTDWLIQGADLARNYYSRKLDEM